MQAMKGATMALGSMNRTMNLPSLQRIALEFERENDIMEQRQDMMDDAIDDAMDVGVEEEGDEVVEQVLEEIGVDLNQAVCIRCRARRRRSTVQPADPYHLPVSTARRNPPGRPAERCRSRGEDCSGGRRRRRRTSGCR